MPDRAHDTELVNRFVQNYHQFRYVRHDDVKYLLGDYRFGQIIKDPIRKLGPIPKTIYPWNVIDYLGLPAEPPETVQESPPCD